LLSILNRILWIIGEGASHLSAEELALVIVTYTLFGLSSLLSIEQLLHFEFETVRLVLILHKAFNFQLACHPIKISIFYTFQFNFDINFITHLRLASHYRNGSVTFEGCNFFDDELAFSFIWFLNYDLLALQVSLHLVHLQVLVLPCRTFVPSRSSLSKHRRLELIYIFRIIKLLRFDYVFILELWKAIQLLRVFLCPKVVGWLYFHSSTFVERLSSRSSYFWQPIVIIIICGWFILLLGRNIFIIYILFMFFDNFVAAIAVILLIIIILIAFSGGRVLVEIVLVEYLWIRRVNLDVFIPENIVLCCLLVHLNFEKV